MSNKNTQLYPFYLFRGKYGVILHYHLIRNQKRMYKRLLNIIAIISMTCIVYSQELRLIGGDLELEGKALLTEDQIYRLFKNYPVAYESYQSSQRKFDDARDILSTTLIVSGISIAVLAALASSDDLGNAIFAIIITPFVPIYTGSQLIRYLFKRERGYKLKKQAVELYNLQHMRQHDIGYSLDLGFGQNGIGLVLSF